MAQLTLVLSLRGHIVWLGEDYVVIPHMVGLLAVLSSNCNQN